MNEYFQEKLMLMTNSALHGSDFLLDGNVKLEIPDFSMQEKGLMLGEATEDSDSAEHL